MDRIQISKEMLPGDRIMYWFSGSQSGIYAAGLVTSEAYEETPSQITESSTWVDTWVAINHAEHPVLKSDIQANGLLNDLTILRSPTGTNFRATQQNWDEYQQIL